MPSESDTEADQPATIDYPVPLFNHPDDVEAVIALPGYRLAVRFFDGTSGIVDMKAMIEGENAGVFAALRDPALFNTVTIDIGTVTWPNGADLAPNAMHAELTAHGEWCLD
jgi:hypothetical protein